MTRRICVFGLWHLGCVTAACLAEQGLEVVGLDLEPGRVEELVQGHPPIAEPGLAEVLGVGLERGNLSFTSDRASALSGTTTLWVTLDTPVDDQDRADVAWVRAQLESVRPGLTPGTLVVVSTQVPVGFTADLERDWRRSDPTLRFVSAPENLRLGQALESFRSPERVVVGLGRDVDRAAVRQLLSAAGERVEWMSLESAEMTKHALNAYLAMSVAYTNEVARICEKVGADAADVERGLRSEGRIGRRAYVKAGAPIAGGTLSRDVSFLIDLAAAHNVESGVLRGVRDSNRAHGGWIRERLSELLVGIDTPCVALLGLTYKVGTDTLRRSSALELAEWLILHGAVVQAYDPAIHELPADAPSLHLAAGIDGALSGADAAVLATPWPEFESIDGDRLVGVMRRHQLIDQVGFLPQLAADERIHYVRVGRPLAARMPG